MGHRRSVLLLDYRTTPMIRSAAIMLRLYYLRVLFFGLLLVCLGSTSCQKESESVVSIALHPTDANILYVATKDTICKSRDGGRA